MEAVRSKWAGRFIAATFALGGIAWLVITVLVIGNLLAGMSPPNYSLGPASSRIVAGGGAGTWFVMGLLSFLVIGIVGIGLSALLYHHVESTLGVPLAGWRTIAAWIHLGLGGIGAPAASLLMTWAGFWAGVAQLDTSSGGWGTPGIIHSTILGPVVLPIAILMSLALVGYLVGGLSLSTAWLSARKR